MSKEFKTKLNEKQDYGTGATRDAAAGKGRFDLIPDLALERVAKVYERGAENHGTRNWEQGLPLSRMLDSAERHIKQYKMSKYRPELRDEDHLAHAIWNLLGVIHEEEMIERRWMSKEMDDLPRYGYKDPEQQEFDWSKHGLDKRDGGTVKLDPAYFQLPESPLVEEDIDGLERDRRCFNARRRKRLGYRDGRYDKDQ